MVVEFKNTSYQKLKEYYSEIGNALNTMIPKSGDTARNVTASKCFADETEFREAVKETKDKYRGCFYKDIQFVEKK